MAFTTNLSGTTQVDDSIVLAYDQSFIVAAGQENVLDAFVQYKADIGAKSISFPKFSRLALATTPLTEDEDVTSEALADAPVILTPAEYGKVVTSTKLASLQTGGKVDVAAATLVGMNLGQTKNKLATLALEASSNVFGVAGHADADIVAGDVMSLTFLNQMYNKLSRLNVPTIGGLYVAAMHDDVINDLRTGTGAGSWQDVSKYATPETALRNEVGMFGGFRIVRNNHATFADQGGAGTVDVYKSAFLGFNGLGLAESKAPGMVATGPFDKLARFVNLGWYGVFQYKIIDTDAVYIGLSSSSVGANAA